MSEHEVQQDEVERHETYDYVPGGRRRKGRGLKGCLAVLIALVVLAGGFWFGLTRGVEWVADQFQGPEDYPGPGTGSVEFTVNEGDAVAQIGRNLKADGVTASVQAFIDACHDVISRARTSLSPSLVAIVKSSAITTPYRRPQR